MADRISYDPEQDRADKKTQTASHDPRLVALVRFLARGAAERDFKRQVARWEKTNNQNKREPT